MTHVLVGVMGRDENRINGEKGKTAKTSRERDSLQEALCQVSGSVLWW